MRIESNSNQKKQFTISPCEMVASLLGRCCPSVHKTLSFGVCPKLFAKQQLRHLMKWSYAFIRWWKEEQAEALKGFVLHRRCYI